MKKYRTLNSNNVPKSKLCGYCKLHKITLTVKELKQKECLKKECWHLIKYQNHPYWIEREKTKQKRKERKEHLDNICKMYNLD